MARGWKARLFNAESASIAELENPTREETVTSYELGVNLEKLPVGTANLSVGAWVKNLTDKQYRVNGLEWGLLTTMHYGDPRTVGVDWV